MWIIYVKRGYVGKLYERIVQLIYINTFAYHQNQKLQKYYKHQ